MYYQRKGVCIIKVNVCVLSKERRAYYQSKCVCIIKVNVCVLSK